MPREPISNPELGFALVVKMTLKEEQFIPEDYEECARCGFDHEYEPEQAHDLHAKCELCMKELNEIGWGNGPDHRCEDHESKGTK